MGVDAKVHDGVLNAAGDVKKIAREKLNAQQSLISEKSPLVNSEPTIYA